MAPRFKEALGRQFDDSASDSSWSAHEVKDLNPSLGTHILPAKLKAAVSSGKLVDLDGFFGNAGVAKPLPVLAINNAPAIPVAPEPLPGYGEQPKHEVVSSAPSTGDMSEPPAPAVPLSPALPHATETKPKKGKK